MFDDVPTSTSDQFHHFIASRTSLPMNLMTTSSSFQLPSFSTAFDHLYPSSTTTTSDHHHQKLQQQQQVHNINSNNNEERSSSKVDPPSYWSDDEVVALLKVRSTMDLSNNNWFPDFSWEHVSRKLEEFGFKRRAADECREKFEEETNRISSFNSNNKKYRIFSELDEFYPHNAENHQQEAHAEVQVLMPSDMIVIKSDSQLMEKQNEQRESPDTTAAGPLVTPNNTPAHQEEMSSEEVVMVMKKVPLVKKRKRREFEIFKGFVEAIVHKMMANQEELHNNLIKDLLKRDEDKIAREEARKNTEMEKMKLVIEKRAQERASAGERQSIIIDFLQKFTSHDYHQLQDHQHKIDHNNVQLNNNNNNLIQNYSSTSLCEVHQSSSHHNVDHQDMVVETSTSNNSTHHQNPTNNSSSPSHHQPSSSTKTCSKLKGTPPIISHELDYDQKGDNNINGGMRWPKDQVMALINLRCRLINSSSSTTTSKDGGGSSPSTLTNNKVGPLWERISQGMMELGYERSAKRCKEKWENINKYFRKTKDSNKKRSVDSRTCPYFHHLNSLYSDGTLVAPSSTTTDQST